MKFPISLMTLLWFTTPAFSAVCENQNFLITARISASAIDAGYFEEPQFFTENTIEVLVKQTGQRLLFSPIKYSTNGAGNDSFEGYLHSHQAATPHLQLHWDHEEATLSGFFENRNRNGRLIKKHLIRDGQFGCPGGMI